MTATTAAGAFPVLQRGERLPTGIDYLPADPEHVLWGRLPCAGDKPVAVVSPGERIVVDTVSHEGILADQGSDPVAFFGRYGVEPGQVLADAVEITARGRRSPEDGPHVVTGPIAVAGARPGDLLAVRTERLELRAPYGVISTRHGRGVLAGDPQLGGDYHTFCSVTAGPGGRWLGTLPERRDPNAPTGHVSFPLAPFLGIVGVATDTATRANSVPPGPHGGNVDIRLLTPGSTLFLPVQVPEALLYVGDPHYAQGNGEVALTAFEAPLRAQLAVDLLPRELVAEELAGVRGPFAAGHGLLVPTGLDADLNEALRRCVRNAVALLGAVSGLEARQAYLYLSAAADFQVSQAVDLVAGVHGELRVADFAVEDAPGPVARRILERAR
ncbi:acetamidase/formamidase family protein [Streptomyces triticirhizae]|uniref:Acetamidase n=1 Tax=Streptomyces triticirhizae TaxID=2483353 RepID=A0A3M2LTG9_9ACTN|nr:acetamidase/formamidase family protein [Streptomyces triticirhizae]RMI40779.1 acetamidase [Streptomyces triticirhizae]